MVSRVGLTKGCGGEGAFMTSRMFCGGWLYPEALSGLDCGADFETGNADCATASADVSETTCAMTSSPKFQLLAKSAGSEAPHFEVRRKAFRMVIVFLPVSFTMSAGQDFYPRRFGGLEQGQ